MRELSLRGTRCKAEGLGFRGLGSKNTRDFQSWVRVQCAFVVSIPSSSQLAFPSLLNQRKPRK